MKNNLLIFLGFAVICLVNITAQKRAQQAAVNPPSTLPAPPAKVEPAPATHEGSASSAISKLGSGHPISASAAQNLR